MTPSTPVKPPNCVWPKCNPADQIEGRCCGWIEAGSTPASTVAGALADGLECCPPSTGGYVLISADERDEIVAALRNSAPQETRGDEPLYRRVITKDRIWYEPAVPQQSPRLEREGIEHARFMKLAQYDDTIVKAKDDGALSDTGRDIIIDSCLASKSAVVAFADAILAILSPDTTVVSSTSRCEVGK